MAFFSPLIKVFTPKYLPPPPAPMWKMSEKELEAVCMPEEHNNVYFLPEFSTTRKKRNDCLRRSYNHGTSSNQSRFDESDILCPPGENRHIPGANQFPPALSVDLQYDAIANSLVPRASVSWDYQDSFHRDDIYWMNQFDNHVVPYRTETDPNNIPHHLLLKMGLSQPEDLNLIQNEGDSFSNEFFKNNTFPVDGYDDSDLHDNDLKIDQFFNTSVPKSSPLLLTDQELNIVRSKYFVNNHCLQAQMSNNHDQMSEVNCGRGELSPDNFQTEMLNNTEMSHTSLSEIFTSDVTPADSLGQQIRPVQTNYQHESNSKFRIVRQCLDKYEDNLKSNLQFVSGDCQDYAQGRTSEHSSRESCGNDDASTETQNSITQLFQIFHENTEEEQSTKVVQQNGNKVILEALDDIQASSSFDEKPINEKVPLKRKAESYSRSPIENKEALELTDGQRITTATLDLLNSSSESVNEIIQNEAGHSKRNSSCTTLAAECPEMILMNNPPAENAVEEFGSDNPNMKDQELIRSCTLQSYESKKSKDLDEEQQTVDLECLGPQVTEASSEEPIVSMNCIVLPEAKHEDEEWSLSDILNDLGADQETGRHQNEELQINSHLNEESNLQVSENIQSIGEHCTRSTNGCQSSMNQNIPSSEADGNENFMSESSILELFQVFQSQSLELGDSLNRNGENVESKESTEPQNGSGRNSIGSEAANMQTILDKRCAPKMFDTSIKLEEDLPWKEQLQREVLDRAENIAKRGQIEVVKDLMVVSPYFSNEDNHPVQMDKRINKRETLKCNIKIENGQLIIEAYKRHRKPANKMNSVIKLSEVKVKNLRAEENQLYNDDEASKHVSEFALIDDLFPPKSKNNELEKSFKKNDQLSGDVTESSKGVYQTDPSTRNIHGCIHHYNHQSNSPQQSVKVAEASIISQDWNTGCGSRDEGLPIVGTAKAPALNSNSEEGTNRSLTLRNPKVTENHTNRMAERTAKTHFKNGSKIRIQQTNHNHQKRTPETLTPIAEASVKSPELRTMVEHVGSPSSKCEEPIRDWAHHFEVKRATTSNAEINRESWEPYGKSIAQYPSTPKKHSALDALFESPPPKVSKSDQKTINAHLKKITHYFPTVKSSSSKASPDSSIGDGSFSDRIIFNNCNKSSNRYLPVDVFGKTDRFTHQPGPPKKSITNRKKSTNEILSSIYNIGYSFESHEFDVPANHQLYEFNNLPPGYVKSMAQLQKRAMSQPSAPIGISRSMEVEEFDPFPRISHQVTDENHEIIDLKEENVEKLACKMESIGDLVEIGFTICYKEKYSILNRPLDAKLISDPIGILSRVEFTGYKVLRIFQTVDELCKENSRSFLLSLLYSNCRKVCFEAQAFIILVLEIVQNVDTKVVYSWHLLDHKIGMWLLDPERPVDGFPAIMECVGVQVVGIANEPLKWMGIVSKFMDAQSRAIEEIYTRLSQLNLWDVFEKMETVLVPILSCMEQKNIMVDCERAKEISKALQIRMSEIEKEAWKSIGKTFSLRSPNQLRKILYEELKLDQLGHVKVKITASGAKTTDEATLKQLKGLHPLPDLVLEYRRAQTIKTTYIDGILQFVTNGNCISTSWFGFILFAITSAWEQCATSTGRITSSKPNLQSIPARDEIIKVNVESFNARQIFIARPGCVFIAVDFQQIELRVFAQLSQDKQLITAFEKQEDIFSTMTQMRLGQANFEPFEREKTKTVTYALLYGAGANKISELLSISKDSAWKICNHFHALFPSIKNFRSQVLNDCRVHKEMRSLSGRRRVFLDISTTNEKLKYKMERMAVNFTIQGSAADIFKAALIRTELAIREHNLDASLLLQIHDELLWEVREEDKYKAIDVIKKSMENTRCYWLDKFKLNINLPVKITTGYNWGCMS